MAQNHMLENEYVPLLQTTLKSISGTIQVISNSLVLFYTLISILSPARVLIQAYTVFF
jgi:hypothetical protein